MVMQRSCSSGRVSVMRASPALAADMMPARSIRESVRVDLPWSTAQEWSASVVMAFRCLCSRRSCNSPWAMTDMLRTLAALSMRARICSPSLVSTVPMPRILLPDDVI